MNTAPPTPEQYTALAAQHASRYPAKYTLTVAGDGGVSVRLPFVLGNPSGSAAWAQTVGIALGLLPDSPDVGRELALDCVLWPAPADLGEWLERWPGLSARLLIEARRKFCGSAAQVVEPVFDEAAPALLAPTLAHLPRAAWRWFTPPDEKIAIAIDPPPSAMWELFVAETQKPGAKGHELALQMAEARAISAVDKDGKPLVIADMFRRWPGLAVLVVRVITDLVGINARAELGGW